MPDTLLALARIGLTLAQVAYISTGCALVLTGLNEIGRPRQPAREDLQISISAIGLGLICLALAASSPWLISWLWVYLYGLREALWVNGW